jgi:hypothetical protein
MLALAPMNGDVAKLGWLTGAWSEHRSDGTWTEEYWTPVRSELMLGAGLTGRGSSVRHFEHMRISKGADGKITFYGMPNGATAVPFVMTRQTENEVVFENAAHDYPQRVAYRRDGNTVIATVSLIDGSKEGRWIYRRP